MGYRLRIGEETVEVEATVEDQDKGNVRFVVGQGEYGVSYQALSQNSYFLMVNGRPTRVFVVQGDRGKHIFVRGRSFLVQDADQWVPRRASRGAPDDFPGQVTPPMPSVVARVLVKEGDFVKRGQGLVVVTAMKMETTLVAHRDGRVRKINTSQGAKVSPGDILVEIEEEAAQDE